MRSIHPIVRVLVFISAGLCVAASGVVAQSSSTNYVLQQQTVSSAGQEASSAGYALGASAGQETTIGTSSSPRFVLQSGFWSFAGSGLVPVILAVDKNPVDLSHVDLDWSGNNSPYDVYQTVDCTNVFASYFDSTPANAYLDISPPGSDLVCYSVLATAPGPMPPPGSVPEMP